MRTQTYERFTDLCRAHNTSSELLISILTHYYGLSLGLLQRDLPKICSVVIYEESMQTLRELASEDEIDPPSELERFIRFEYLLRYGSLERPMQRSSQYSGKKRRREIHLGVKTRISISEEIKTELKKLLEEDAFSSEEMCESIVKYQNLSRHCHFKKSLEDLKQRGNKPFSCERAKCFRRRTEKN